MKIKVTKEHIRNGRPCQMDRCPVALAMCEAGLGFVVVGNFLLGYDDHRALRQPKSVHEFVKRFDAGKSVKPFVFVLPK